MVDNLPETAQQGWRNRGKRGSRLSDFGRSVIPKDQLISKCPFGAFKSSKKPTKFFQDFCPSLKKEVKSKKQCKRVKIKSFNYWYKGQKSGKNSFGYLGNLKAPKGHFEINWQIESHPKNCQYPIINYLYL